MTMTVSFIDLRFSEEEKDIILSAIWEYLSPEGKAFDGSSETYILYEIYRQVKANGELQCNMMVGDGWIEYLLHVIPANSFKQRNVRLKLIDIREKVKKCRF